MYWKVNNKGDTLIEKNNFLKIPTKIRKIGHVSIVERKITTFMNLGS